MDQIGDAFEEIADEQGSFDWDQYNWDEFLAEEAKLHAEGYTPAFSSRDYPTQEAAMEAFDRFGQNIIKKVLREAAAGCRADTGGE